MVLGFKLRGHTVKVPSLNVTDPWAAFGPQPVYIRQAGTAVVHSVEKLRAQRMVGNLVGVVLYLRAEVHQPVVDGQIILEAVIVGISKMHFAHQSGQIAVFCEMVAHSAVAPVKLVVVGDCTGAVCVQSGQ